jgi:hypothetical protein
VVGARRIPRRGAACTSGFTAGTKLRRISGARRGRPQGTVEASGPRRIVTATLVIKHACSLETDKIRLLEAWIDASKPVSGTKPHHPPLGVLLRCQHTEKRMSCSGKGRLL